MKTAIPTNWFARMFSYTIGRKLIMALTGIFLVTFLIVHVVGNFQLFAGDNGVSFNEYSHHLTTNPFIKTVEWGLLFGFGFHIIDGFILYFQN